MVWSQRELEILQLTSRISSAFSLAGALFIIFTFCTSRGFHRPINRLAFFAAFGNILTNVATITSRDGIRAGQNSALCQAQGMIIQWAIPADALFCLAMAINVNLAVFKKRTTQQLRKLEPYYIVGCYGIPLIPAIIFLVDRPASGPFYGDATLWCWIAPEWNILRITAFYGPVWYAMAEGGLTQAQNLSLIIFRVVLFVTFFIYVLAGRVIFNLRNKLRIIGNATRPNPYPRRLSFTQQYCRRPSFKFRRAESPSPPPPPPKDEAQPGCITVNTTIANNVQTITPPEPVILGSKESSASSLHEATYTCTVTSVSPYQPKNSGFVVPVTVRQPPTLEVNTAAWAYCRCAMLFFLALVITWLPSSINRVNQLQNPDSRNFNLNFAAALVLPAQGFWNGLIYIVTTYSACRRYFAHIGEWISERRDEFLNLFLNKKTSRMNEAGRKGDSQYSFPSSRQLNSPYGWDPLQKPGMPLRISENSLRRVSILERVPEIESFSASFVSSTTADSEFDRRPDSYV